MTGSEFARALVALLKVDDPFTTAVHGVAHAKALQLDGYAGHDVWRRLLHRQRRASARQNTLERAAQPADCRIGRIGRTALDLHLPLTTLGLGVPSG